MDKFYGELELGCQTGVRLLYGNEKYLNLNPDTKKEALGLLLSLESVIIRYYESTHPYLF
ncbi:hypothetical protein [Vibrio gallaecicus]|uniref:hypothetical protein n=1 Tax=Vibrio gallaecicus TaxID=552386 RepID=UPI0025B501CB|nr:hypothetical protein [Vibrio gallaecicus]MDN3614550.1 hypothetical protein [Vibrio gallaecicus]